MKECENRHNVKKYNNVFYMILNVCVNTFWACIPVPYNVFL